MATHDALLLFRQALASGRSLTPTTSSTPSPNATEAPLSQATHLQFNLSPSPVCLPLDTPTRYVDSNGEPFDLRSVYFAYRHHQVTIVEYNAKVKSLNDEFAASGSVASRRVQGVSFVERLELVTWLEGADECDRIKPLEGAAAQAAAAAADAASSSAAATGGAGATGGRSGKGTLDPRLQAVYNGERKMGDRNTVLRGIKPTDFSHVRKLAAQFVIKKPSNGTNTPSGPGSQPSSLPLNPKAPRRRPDPIILLSQSASSLLRASNIKLFLEDGLFMPPDMSNTGINRLHIMHTAKDIDPHRPTRFILVEGTSDFKPNYWNQVVAVFTTGQEWQFKSYRWSNANELFKHVLGVFVGYRGEEPPENVRTWGHRIVVANVERPREKPAGLAGQAQTEREPNYRDREAADNIWRAIETSMRNKGWRRDTCPTVI